MPNSDYVFLIKKSYGSRDFDSESSEIAHISSKIILMCMKLGGRIIRPTCNNCRNL